MDNSVQPQDGVPGDRVKAFYACINLLPTWEAEQIGRRTPFRSGYRPLLRFTGDDRLVGAEITLDTHEWCSPGETCHAMVQLMYPISLNSGAGFTLHEGNRLVGHGTVLEIWQI